MRDLLLTRFPSVRLSMSELIMSTIYVNNPIVLSEK